MLTIASWNVNGLRASLKNGSLMAFLDQYAPDIIALQEVKAYPEQFEHDFGAYHSFWNPAEKKGYSGTAILTKRQPLSVTNNFPSEIAQEFHLVDDASRDSDSEGRVITAEYENFCVASIYTPNAKDDLSRLPLVSQAWDPALKRYLSQLQTGKPVIAVGDLNVARNPEDLARPKENEGRKGYTKEEREGLESILSIGLIDSFRLLHQGSGYYTWWSHWAQARARNIGWRIDYCLISDSLKDKVVATEIYPQVTGSDHCPISVSLDLNWGR